MREREREREKEREGKRERARARAIERERERGRERESRREKNGERVRTVRAAHIVPVLVAKRVTKYLVAGGGSVVDVVRPL